MAKKNKMRPVRLGFVDLAGDDYPKQGQDYNIVTAASHAVGSLPYPGTEYKLFRMQLLNMYVEDLPDFTNQNEALLKLGGETRDHDESANKEKLTYSIDFNVKDRSYAPGFLNRVVFRNVLLREYFDLGLDLVELDKNLSDTYSKVAKVVDDSGLSGIDAINSIPYIKVATKLFDGLIRTFGKNADDVVWKEVPGLYLVPAPGGAFLRTGVYVLFEQRSIYSTRKGNKKPGKAMPISKLLYRDGEVRHASDANWPLSNHLVFNTLLEAKAPK